MIEYMSFAYWVFKFARIGKKGLIAEGRKKNLRELMSFFS